MQARKCNDVQMQDIRVNRQSELGVTHMQSVLNRFVKCESGATAIEYGLIAALISVACIGVLQGVGSNLGKTFDKIKGNLT
jgi:pilus assembly protein Flp/PilA